MKRLLLNLMLLLCALVAGSGSVWGDTYVKVTSPSDLVSGDVYIIANSTGIATSYSSNTLQTTSTGYSDVSGTITTSTVTPMEFTLGTTSGNYTLKMSDNKYLGYSGSKTNFQNSEATGSNTKEQWTIAYNSTYDLFTIVNVNTTGRHIGSGSDCFKAYASMSDNQPATLYKKQAAISVTNLSVKTVPAIIEYKVGESLNLSGLVLDADGNDVTSGYTASPANGSTLSETGTKTVTITYGGKTCTQTIYVGELTGIEITTAPTKTTYNEGQTFDPIGMVVTASYDTGDGYDWTEAVSDYTFSPNTALGTSNTTITVSYGGQTDTQTITVNAGVPYTVSFDAGNGTCGIISLTEEAYQSGVEIPSATANTTGWTFYGWATSKQITETTIAPDVVNAGETYYPTDNITLYAIYTLTEVEEKVVTGSDLTGTATATRLDEAHPITYKISSSNSYSNPLRVYKNNTLTIAGGTMSKIVLSGNDSSNPISNLGLTSGGGSLSKGTWTGSSTSVVFTASAQARVSSIQVTYTASTTIYYSLPASKAALSYTSAEYDGVLGRSFTKPVLTNTNDVTVTYSSDNTSVATVDVNTGEVTIVGVGSAIITASFAGNASYRANSASYVLNVCHGTIAQIKELTNNGTAVDFTADLSDAVITYVSGDYAYLQDATAAVNVNFSSHGLTAGKKINGKVTGTIKASYQIDVLTAFDFSEATLSDADIPAATVATLATIKNAGNAYDGKLVTVNGATVTGSMASTASSGASIEDGSQIEETNVSFNIIAPNKGITLNESEIGNFTGFVSIYNGSTYRLNLYEAAQYQKTQNSATTQPLAFAEISIELDEDTQELTDFAGQTVSGAKGTVTYSKEDASSIISSFNAETGAITLSGACGTATITATASASSETIAGVTTPYTATTESYTITVSPRYTLTFSVNGEKTEVRQATSGASVVIPTPATIGDYKFMGWSTTTVDATNVAPSMTAPVTIPTANVTYYAVYALMGTENVTATFDPTDISATPTDGTRRWKHTDTGITLYLSAGQHYTSKTPYTFTVTAGTSNYFEVSVDGKLTSIVTTITNDNSTYYKINDVSEGASLNTDGTTQTVSFTSDLSSVKCYATSSYQIRATLIVVNAIANTLSDYRTSLPTSTTVTITAAKYATYCNNRDMDFSATGITVYKAKVNGSVVKLTAISDGIVPANTGVILYKDVAESTNIDVPFTTTAATISDNELVGTTARVLVKKTDDNVNFNYILQAGPVFNMATTDGAYMPANRAYLSTTYDASPSGARLSVVFDDETDGITTNNREAITNNLYYDLQGRRVAQPKKGSLYIVNGRKMFVK